jgi:hypothetical protein
MKSEVADQIRCLVGCRLDWKSVFEAAAHHGLVPLVYEHLRAVCRDAVPVEVFEQFQEVYRSNGRRCLRMTGELLRLQEMFRVHGIRSLTFKGPALAASAYGNLALRQYNDLDMLVHPKDVLRARELLVSDGYQPLTQFTPQQEVRQLSQHYEYGFRHRDRGVLLELQWKFAPPYFNCPLAAEGCLSRATSITVSGIPVTTLAVEDHLLVLCMHGTKHYWERLEWICGVAELIRAHPDIDLTASMRRAAALGIERVLSVALYLMHDLLQTDLPEAIVRTIQTDSHAVSSANRVRAALFGAKRSSPGACERIFFHLRTRDRARQRFIYCLRLTVCPSLSDVEFVALPRSLSFLYYIVRPARLIAKSLRMTRLKVLPSPISVPRFALCLDNVLNDEPEPDFIKIDVEGAAAAVLRGATRSRRSRS